MCWYTTLIDIPLRVVTILTMKLVHTSKLLPCSIQYSAFIKATQKQTYTTLPNSQNHPNDTNNNTCYICNIVTSHMYKAIKHTLYTHVYYRKAQNCTPCVYSYAVASWSHSEAPYYIASFVCTVQVVLKEYDTRSDTYVSMPI